MFFFLGELKVGSCAFEELDVCEEMMFLQILNLQGFFFFFFFLIRSRRKIS